MSLETYAGKLAHCLCGKWEQIGHPESTILGAMNGGRWAFGGLDMWGNLSNKGSTTARNSADAFSAIYCRDRWMRRQPSGGGVQTQFHQSRTGTTILGAVGLNPTRLFFSHWLLPVLAGKLRCFADANEQLQSTR